MEKKKKPFFKRWWFIALVIIILIGALGSGGEDEPKDEIKEPVKQTAISNEDSSKRELTESEKKLLKKNFSDFTEKEKEDYAKLAYNYAKYNDEYSDETKAVWRDEFVRLQAEALEVFEEEKVVDDNVEYIIGSNKMQVTKFLTDKGYTIDNKNVEPNVIEFLKDEMVILVYFDEDDISEGIWIESYDGDFVTGEGSYVSLHYDELILLASGDKNIDITNDLIEFNNLGNLKYPTVLIIGHVPEI